MPVGQPAVLNSRSCASVPDQIIFYSADLFAMFNIANCLDSIYCAFCESANDRNLVCGRLACAFMT